MSSKARSRLHQENSDAAQPILDSTHSSEGRSKLKLRQSQRLSLPQRYLKHLPTGLLSLPFWLALGWMMTNFYPSQLANWPLPQAYLPFHLLLLMANFFTFSFLFLKTRRGMALATFIQGLLFLKLQNVEITVLVAVVWAALCFGPLLLLELSLRFFDRK